MAGLTQGEDAFEEYNNHCEETFIEIRKNLLDDFETAKTVTEVAKHNNAKVSGVSGSREPVKVYLRVRPFTNKELTAGESQGCLEIVNSLSVLMHPPKTSFTFKHQSRHAITAETVHRFGFSGVFGPDTTQKSFFEDTSLGVVRDFIDGQNCLVFSYGVTNAGKTYTILGNAQNLGILPRTINILFNSFKDQNYERANLKPKMFCDVVKLSSIQEEREDSKKKMLLSLIDIPTYHNSVSSTELSLQDISQEQSCHEALDSIDLSSLLDVTSVDIDTQGPIQFALWVSYAEIYNENIYDLLEPISLGKDTCRKRTVLKVGDDRKGNPYIKGLTEIHVNNAGEALKLLKIGRKNQKIASTKLNENSSRSHCIFTLKILRVVNKKEPHVARVSRLSFVDLAGSERYTKTKNTGVRLKEAGNINTSIMTLGKCVEILRHNQYHPNNPRNVPFRESKLTRVFQGFFCGKGKASMIVNVNQCASAFDETLHALRFSAIASKVTTLVHPPATGPPPPPPPEPQETVLPRSTRASVAWADGSLSTPIGNKVRLNETETPAQLAPLAEEEHFDISEHTNQELQALVIGLQGKLIEEKKNMAMLEVKIREEVSQEMAEQLVEIENNYNERLIEDERNNKELYEQRIDLLSKSVKKRGKRARVDRVEDEDDEWVSSLLLHREQVKVQEMSEKILKLEEVIKKTQSSVSEEVESLKIELCRRDDEIESLEKTLTESKSELEKEISKRFKTSESLELKARDEKIATLERTLKDCKEELGAKTSQLLAAKKIHDGRSTTPAKTTANTSLLQQLQRRLEETTRALDRKNSQLFEKNSIIAKLESSLNEMRNDMKDQEKKLGELISEKNKKKEDSERKIEDLKAQTKKKECEIEARTREKEEAVENLRFVERELKILTSKEDDSQTELAKLRFEQEKLRVQHDQVKADLEKRVLEKEDCLEKAEHSLKDTENALKDAEAKVKKLQSSNEDKGHELLRRDVKIKDLTEASEMLTKRLAEFQENNGVLEERYSRALEDLVCVQATVQARNQKLEHFENLDKSLKDANRDKETEIMHLRREMENARNKLRDKEKELTQVKNEMEKRMNEEIIKVNENWESTTERMKIGLAEQEEVLAQMEKDLASKENELTDLRQETEELSEKIKDKNEKLKKLREENENLDDLSERLKIKVFELETEVEKLQQDVKKEASKKDTATQALRDGLEIVKTKKVEYETRLKEVEREKTEMMAGYGKKVKKLEDEIAHLKSDSSETSEGKTTCEKGSGSTNSGKDKTYKTFDVESFTLPASKGRVEIDVTPITGSGLRKGGKKTDSTKPKTLKRKSSDLTLKEIKDQIHSKSKTGRGDCSEDDFTPVSATKLRKTRSSSMSGRSCQVKANLLSSPSTFSLSTLDENSENTNPLVTCTSRNSHKATASSKRAFFNKLGLPESGKAKIESSSLASGGTEDKDPVSSAKPMKNKKRKLLKKSEISLPFCDSPLSQSDKLKPPKVSRAQELITRQLRSRVVKTAR